MNDQTREIQELKQRNDELRLLLKYEQIRGRQQDSMRRRELRGLQRALFEREQECKHLRAEVNAFWIKQSNGVQSDTCNWQIHREANERADQSIELPLPHTNNGEAPVITNGHATNGHVTITSPEEYRSIF